jgi:hypothetical protein
VHARLTRRRLVDDVVRLVVDEGRKAGGAKKHKSFPRRTSPPLRPSVQHKQKTPPQPIEKAFLLSPPSPLSAQKYGLYSSIINSGCLSTPQADVTDPALAAELKKKRTFRTFSYRGVALEKLLDLNTEEVCPFISSLYIVLTLHFQFVEV